MVTLKTIFYGSLGLLIFFIIMGSVALPFFADYYEHGYGTTPCNADNTCTGTSTNLRNSYCVGSSTTRIACANCNISTGYATFLSNCFSLIDEGAHLNDTYCYQCTDFGFKTSIQGLGLLVFVISILAVAFIYFTAFQRIR